jgi:transmembrane sensor
MAERERWIDQARRATEVTVGPAWRARIIEGATRERPRTRLPLVALAAGACAMALALAVRPPRPARTAVAPRPVTPSQELRFDEGATGAALGSAEAVVAERSTRRTRVQLRRGAVRFEVTHNGREFRVEAGPVTVIVVGTAFTVERTPAGTRVAVQRGRVRVEGPGTRVELGMGESRWFGADTAEAPAPAVPAAAPTRPAPARWQALARRGDYDEAYRMLQRGSEPRDDVEDLLLAADSARYSSHWAEALPYYDRVLTRYERDPRAGLAAFTKARLLMHQLDRPAAAAAAFAKARALTLPESLRRDALAREAQAWARAGNSARARDRAEQYLRMYPDGPARQEARELAGR